MFKNKGKDQDVSDGNNGQSAHRMPLAKNALLFGL
jgi:hypothetical protein